ADSFLAIEDDPTSLEVDPTYYDPDGDIPLLEAILNSDPSPPPNQGNYLLEIRKDLKICETNNEKSSVNEPPEVELKDLPPHLEYAFLEGNDKLPVIIAKDLKNEEKAALIEVLKSYKRAIAWKLSNIKGIDPEFYTNLVLNWEKSHFKVKEGIVLGHKISKSGIEVDRAKVDVIAKLPHPTTVKGVRSFLGHAGFYRRFIQDFSKISRPMTHLLEKETPFFFSKECIESFNTLKRKLTEAPILIAPDWDLPFELMCDASDFAIGAVLGQRKNKHFQPIHYASKTMTEAQAHYTTTEKELLAVVYAFEKFRSYLVLSKSINSMLSSETKKGAENLAADHLSRLENPHQDKLENKEITETFPLETLGSVALRVDSTPWFADFANYHAGISCQGNASPTEKQSFQRCKHYFWEDPSCSNSVADK
ncbi:reverse transcriptase domain-containing protein, partial [Tanacetum coccineum]